MNTPKSLSLLLITAALISCNKSKTEKTIETVTPKQVETTNVTIKKESFSNSGKVTVKGKEYEYKFTFNPCDSLPIVTNSVGQKYYDNIVDLIITEGERKIYKHTFEKTSFNEIVPANFMQTSALVGFNYNYNKENDHSAFFFIVTVGDPDDSAELSYPMELTIETNGRWSVKKAENLDTEPINQGMSQDPQSDSGV